LLGAGLSHVPVVLSKAHDLLVRWREDHLV
jgi:hypothetical protein